MIDKTSFAKAKARADLLESDEWKAKRNMLTSQWSMAKQILEQAKAQEQRLRLQLVEHVANPDKDSGTESFLLDFDKRLKIVKVLNYHFKLDGMTPTQAANTLLVEMRKQGPEGIFLADRLVRWTPELVVGEYKKLPDELKGLADKVITAEPGMPSVILEG